MPPQWGNLKKLTIKERRLMILVSLKEGHKPLVSIPQDEFEKMLNRAAEEGAKRALHDVGLDVENAAEDIRELRLLLSALQFARRIALKTFVKVIPPPF